MIKYNNVTESQRMNDPVEKLVRPVAPMKKTMLQKRDVLNVNRILVI